MPARCLPTPASLKNTLASGVTLDRFCGSGITSVNLAAASIMSGMEDLVIAGGTEMMSMPGRRSDEGPALMDAGNLRLRASHPQTHQGICADAIATLEGISRADLDALALESQKRAAAIELKIKVASVNFGLHKKLHTAVFPDLALKQGMNRAHMLIFHTEDAINICVIIQQFTKSPGVMRASFRPETIHGER